MEVKTIKKIKEVARNREMGFIIEHDYVIQVLDILASHADETEVEVHLCEQMSKYTEAVETIKNVSTFVNGAVMLADVL